MSPSITSLAGSKNPEAAVVSATAALIKAVVAVAPIVPGGSAATTVRKPIRPDLSTSAHIMIRRLSYRSTRTPTIGDTTIATAATTTSTMLLTSGAYGRFLNKMTAIHNNKVVLNTESPNSDTV